MIDQKAIASEERLTRVKHSVNIGDLIAAMGAIKKYNEITKRKVIVAQQVGLAAQYYPGAVHPTVDEYGTQVCCNLPMWEMIKPLIESQEYIHSFEKYTGQRIDLDFDVIRGQTFVNLPHGAIQGWIPLAFPDLAFDMSKPWITVDGKCPTKIKKQIEGKAILNFTERYRNPNPDYFFMKGYAPDLVFAGTEKEHWLFCNKWNLDIPRLEINNFLDYAYALRECRFFYGNQSFGWNLAEAMKVPRVMEVCQFAQNCIFGVGEHSYGFFHKVGAEYYFRKLYNITQKKSH